MKVLSRNVLSALALATGTLLVSACNATPAPPVAKTADSTADAAPARATLPLVKVYKDPNCGCCGGWAEHMRAAGFPVEIHDKGARIKGCGEAFLASLSRDRLR